VSPERDNGASHRQAIARHFGGFAVAVDQDVRRAGDRSCDPFLHAVDHDHQAIVAAGSAVSEPPFMEETSTSRGFVDLKKNETEEGRRREEEEKSTNTKGTKKVQRNEKTPYPPPLKKSGGRERGEGGGE